MPAPGEPAVPASSAESAQSTVADAVVVGGGTVGAWCAYFLRRSGLERVVLIEKRTLGQGASSRAAGVVRTQGGTRWAVQLGEWSRRFYLGQAAELGIDSGFTPQGYVLPCFTAADVAAARERLTMQTALGLDVRWLEPAQLDALNPTLAPGLTLGGTYCPDDGYLTPPRNVTAYAVALARVGVDVRERVSFTGLQLAGQELGGAQLSDRGLAGQELPGPELGGAPFPAGPVTGVYTSAGLIATPRVVLTGGPELAEVASLAGVTVPAGGVRHQVAVTEPHPDLAPDRLPMVFDLAAGLYWRPEEGGLLFGMSNPDEPPGPARAVDEPYLELMRRRLAELVPVTAGLGLRRVWAATIDYTPDHLPIIGPALASGPGTAAGGSAAGGSAAGGSAVGGTEIGGVTVASAGGAGMMWGPAVARAAADVALTGTSDVVDVADLGLDRFDAAGNSKLATDPIALPFPGALPL
jgi:sarcosine oxidase, subunit beta